MKEILVLETNSSEEILGAIRQRIEGKTFFGLRGDVGAGKTTFVSQLLQNEKVNVASPTFALYNTYSAFGLTIIHVDLFSLGYFTAKIVKKGELYALESGVLSGRFSASRFLTGLEAASSAKTGPLCGENPIYKSVRDGVCRARDFPRDPTLDGKESPCDALSLAIGFAAEPAQLGRVVTAPTVPSPCGDTWVATCP